MDKRFDSYFTSRNPEISLKSAQAVLSLVEDGGTVPFIARYRKEKTGNLDEVQIRAVIDSFETFNEVIKRKTFVLEEVEKQGNLTPELKKRLEESMELSEIEELYRPFKKKKKTKATIAREAGLEPLADWLLGIGKGDVTPEVTLEVEAKKFINPSKKFATYDEALKGAQDIIVERLNNNTDLRNFVRDHLNKEGKVVSKASKKYKPNSKYEMYQDYSEAVKNLFERKASHRYLAMRRGWKEGELAVSIQGDDEALLNKFQNEIVLKKDTIADEVLKSAAKTSLNVHVMPSITNEIHSELKEKADLVAIDVFAENVRKILLASPFGNKCVLGVDPGIRTGCKVALTDKQGNYISHTVLHIQGDQAKERAIKLFEDVLKQIEIEAVAVGNGTGGREAEKFLREILKELARDIPVILISESGASVYSASEVAREEFPDLDLTVRGAISIARRLQDPLAELVKIEPKSIGVGQYQHDVSQSLLKKKLTEVVESSVNKVGVDLNTSSASLLSYVSGIGPALAKNIVDYRRTNGLFTQRDELMNVTRFSSKVFEQSAGFLRIQEGKVFLDKTGVHPERYQAVREMAGDLGVSVSDLVGAGAKKLLELRTKWAELIGEFTFDDIVKELEEPGRDPRDPYKVFSFREDINEVSDLKKDMICNGIVTNVTNFGAFVDIGVHQDGLVHISEISNQFVDDPRKVVNPGDQVQVKVLDVDTEKSQISLSMKLTAPKASKAGGKRDDNRSGKGGGPKRGKGAGKGQGKGAGKRSGGGRKDGGKRPPRPKNPFNNPFAALADLGDSKDSKSKRN